MNYSSYSSSSVGKMNQVTFPSVPKNIDLHFSAQHFLSISLIIELFYFIKLFSDPHQNTKSIFKNCIKCKTIMCRHKIVPRYRVQYDKYFLQGFQILWLINNSKICETSKVLVNIALSTVRHSFVIALLLMSKIILSQSNNTSYSPCILCQTKYFKYALQNIWLKLKTKKIIYLFSGL